MSLIGLFVDTVLGTTTYMSDRRKPAGAIVGEVANPGGLTEVGVNTLQKTLPEALAVVRDRMRERIAQRKSDLISSGKEPA